MTRQLWLKSNLYPGGSFRVTVERETKDAFYVQEIGGSGRIECMPKKHYDVIPQNELDAAQREP